MVYTDNCLLWQTHTSCTNYLQTKCFLVQKNGDTEVDANCFYFYCPTCSQLKVVAYGQTIECTAENAGQKISINGTNQLITCPANVKNYCVEGKVDGKKDLMERLVQDINDIDKSQLSKGYCV